MQALAAEFESVGQSVRELSLLAKETDVQRSDLPGPGAETAKTPGATEVLGLPHGSDAEVKAALTAHPALPPGTPNKLCLLRCSVSAAHTEAEIDRIIELFGSVVAQGHGLKAANG